MLSESELNLIRDVDKNLDILHNKMIDEEERIIEIVDKIKIRIKSAFKTNRQEKAYLMSCVDQLPKGFYRSELRTMIMNHFSIPEE